MEHRENYLLLWGGVDINPLRYGQKPLKECQHPNNRRDELEFHAVQTAFKKGIPVVGVCRGAQLLCIANGGSLYQHSPDHECSHALVYKEDGDEKKIEKAAAGHHQIMNPIGTKHEVIAWCPSPTKVFNENREEIILMKAPEIVWFPETKSLAIQPHPEWDDNRFLFVSWINETLYKLLGIQGVF